MIYNNNYKRNLISYWRQYFPDWEIPIGFHVHHIKPRCTFEDKNDLRIHHPKNLIALHPDDHVSIHECRGDTHLTELFITSVVGRVASDEFKKKISQTHKGKVLSEHTKQLIRESRTGTKHTERSKQKMSEIQKNIPHTKEWNENVSRAKKGKESPLRGRILQPRTEDVKEKISNTKRGIKWYNNGLISKTFMPGLEDNGFVLGRLPFKNNRRWYTNGKTVTQFIPGEEPSGFTLGRKYKEEMKYKEER